MLKPAAGYLVKLILPVIAVLGGLGWVFVSRLRELDALPRLEKSMGLYQQWRERVADLERRFPFADSRRQSWEEKDLQAYLIIKRDIVEPVEQLQKGYPALMGGQLGQGLEQSRGLLPDLLALRSRLLLALERQGMSVSQYLYFNQLADDFRSQGSTASPVAALSDAQRGWIQKYAQDLLGADARGIELLGLPRP